MLQADNNVGELIIKMKKYPMLLGCIALIFLFYSVTALAERKNNEIVLTPSQTIKTPQPTLSPDTTFSSKINTINTSMPIATPKPNIYNLSRKIVSSNVNNESLSLTGSPSIIGRISEQNTIIWKVYYENSGIYGNRLEMYNSKMGWIDVSDTYYTANGSYSIANLDGGDYLGRLTYLVNGSWVTVDHWIEILDTPKIERIYSNDNSITWRVKYPKSGNYGNRLELYSESSGWSDISNTYYTDNGYYTSNNLMPNESYKGRLTYYNSSIGTWITLDLIIRTNWLSSPVNLTLENSSNTVKLHWNKPLDTRGKSINYKIYNGETQIGTTDKTNFSYDIVNIGTYMFSVSAFDSIGESSKSNIVRMQQTNLKLNYHYNNGLLDYIVLSSNTKLVFQYDNNGNLLRKIIMPLNN